MSLDKGEIGRECFLYPMTSPQHGRPRSVCVFVCVRTLMTRRDSSVCTRFFLRAEFRWHHLSNRTLACSDCGTQTHQAPVWFVSRPRWSVFVRGWVHWLSQATSCRLQMVDLWLARVCLCVCVFAFERVSAVFQQTRLGCPGALAVQRLTFVFIFMVSLFCIFLN